jgi:NADP-dependent 3-hydroxy acid dehydrogenase YdfG
MEKQASSATAGCSKATAQQLADALDDIWLCANSGYSLEDLKAKIGMYTEGNASLTKGF